MLIPDYEYSIHIDEHAPLAPQPEKIIIPLKPHQRASLHKAIVMETHGVTFYNVQNPERYISSRYSNTNINNEIQFRGKFKIQTNVGILGDAIGSGKTALSLAIVAATPVTDIHKRTESVHSFQGRTGSYLRGTMVMDSTTHVVNERPSKLKTTLIIVPRGPVYSQYVTAIQSQTQLNVLCIDSITIIKRIMPKPTVSNDALREFIEQFDAILIKNTSLKTLHEYYGNREGLPMSYGWERIIVDEACDILTHVPMYQYSFLWLISATYMYIVNHTSPYRNQLGYSIRDVIVSSEVTNLALVRCTDQFVTRSFNVPPSIESYYVCELPRQLAAVHSFLSPNVRERIDANDLMGALSLLGATEETENDVVTLVTKEIERDIRNKEREIEYIGGLDLPEDVRASRLVTPTTELNRLKDKLTHLIERVTEIESKSCMICMDSIENPLLLPCSHLFCAKCIVSWMQFNHNTCPTCRVPIQVRQLVSIVKAKQTTEESNRASSSTADQPTQIQTHSKEDTLVNIIQANPTGKFVVFSRLDSSYWGCTSRLRSSGISFNLLRGNSNVMASVLDRFRNGETRVLLLNTVHAASGIDISSATDLIIVHDLGTGRTQAVGRCNRHPRTIPLRIHQLCYPHEMNTGNEHSAPAAPPQSLSVT